VVLIGLETKTRSRDPHPCKALKGNHIWISFVLN